MLSIEVSSPSPESSSLQTTPTLADLSRNASVISSSSSSSSASDLTLQTPVRPRPLRTFSSPRAAVRSRSPQSPSTPRSSRPPAYLARELGLSDERDDEPSDLRPPASRARSRSRCQSRNSSVNGRVATTADDFEFGKVLGEGSYSTVMLAKHRTTQQEYAIKILDKGHLRRNGKLPTALAEKNTLVRLGAGHPGIVRLHWAFQDEWSLYFVLDLARNGELQSRISRMGSLSTESARVYAAQIVDALGYMHSKGVIHRDLKPENLLLDGAFRIKITDFGTGKILDSGGERTKTFVGTAQYVSPELLEDSETSKSSDFWALGCIVYQMISGRFAFQGLSEYLTWQKIKKLEYAFPEGFDEQAKDLVQKLLVRDPALRLGAGSTGSNTDMEALRDHPFFASINWGTLWTDAVPPLESGLVKKEPLKGANGEGWDVGASWDALVGDSDPEDDISWASEGEGQDVFATQGAKAPNGYAYHEDVGPAAELRPYAFPPAHGHNTDDATPPRSISAPFDSGKDEVPSVRFAGMPKASATNGVSTSNGVLANGAGPSHDIPSVVKAQPIDVPAFKGPVVDSSSTGSATSSSDGSPIEQLGAALQSAGMDRGRNRAQTPIQGNHPAADPEWTSLLLPHESVLFNTAVEASAPKRRGSRLLAMAVTPRRLKSRDLILTTHRLLCLKRKPGRAVQVRTELFMTPSSEKEKDGRHIISGVEPKGEREFVVMTSTKSHCFLSESPSMASMWIRKIQEALRTHAPAPGSNARTASTSRTRT